MTQPEGQPTTMTVREPWEDELQERVDDWMMNDITIHAESLVECIVDFFKPLISNAKEEAEKRGYSRGYHEGRGQRDFTGREVEPKAL